MIHISQCIHILVPGTLEPELYKLTFEPIQKLAAAFKAFGHRNHHLVKFERSRQEAHAQALFLADHLPVTGLVKQTDGELAHLHSGGEHSGHFCLAPADCKLFLRN